MSFCLKETVADIYNCPIPEGNYSIWVFVLFFKILGMVILESLDVWLGVLGALRNPF